MFYQRYLFIITFLFLTDCAGKPQVMGMKERFIPESKTTIFLSSFINLTQKEELEIILREYLEDHFKFSKELTYSHNFRQADIYLGLDINRFIEEELLNTIPTENPHKRLLFKVTVSLKDIKSKVVYIEKQEIEVSGMYIEDKSFKEQSEEKALVKLFEKIVVKINQLIVNGTIVVNSLYGYEGNEAEANQIVPANFSRSQNSEDDYFQIDSNETNKLQNEEEINRKDRDGTGSEQR